MVLLLFLGRIGGFELADPDEGRYAEIPREMIESGDWVTPTLNYVKYFEKPPLLYWLVALSFEAFGQNEGAARLTPALSGVTAVVLAYLLGVCMFRRRRPALLGAAILVTSPLFFAFSQALVIDMLLTACMTAALAATYAAHVEDRKDRWALVAALACALGVLAKGPVGLVLPGAIALAYLLLEKDYDTIRALLSWKPIASFLLIAAPWFALVSARNPGFAEFFFIREHLQRFAADVGHPEGPLYYVPVLLLGALPWTALFAALSWDRPFRAAFLELPHGPRAFLLLWAGVVLAFFSVASSKLAGYILPAFPPLALLAGAWLDGALARSRRSRRLMARAPAVLAGVGLVVMLVAAVGWWNETLVVSAIRVDSAGLRAACGGLLAVGLALVGVWIAEWVTRTRTAMYTSSPAWLVAALALALFGAIGGRDAAESSRELGRVAAAVVPPGGRLVSYRELRQGLPFYFGRRVVQAEYLGELAFGAGQTPDRDEYFWQDERLEDVAARSAGLWIVAHESRIEQLRERLRSPLPVLMESEGLALLECLPCGAGSGS